MDGEDVEGHHGPGRGGSRRGRGGKRARRKIQGRSRTDSDGDEFAKGGKADSMRGNADAISQVTTSGPGSI